MGDTDDADDADGGLLRVVEARWSRPASDWRRSRTSEGCVSYGIPFRMRVRPRRGEPEGEAMGTVNVGMVH